jgi:hypothetical protein
MINMSEPVQWRLLASVPCHAAPGVLAMCRQQQL